MVMLLPVNVPYRSLQCRPQVRHTGDALRTHGLRDPLDPCLCLLRTLRQFELLLNPAQINEVRQWKRQCARAGSMLEKTVKRIDAAGKECRSFRRAFA